MAKVRNLNLLDYVNIQDEGATLIVELIAPFTKWPEPLLVKYGAIVRLLTCPDAAEELLEYPQHVAFCSDVRVCPKKTDAKDNPSCARNVFGICCDATYFYNEGAIPCRALGLMQGYSAARIQQMQSEASAKLRRMIMADPSMVEMCREFRVGGMMPSGQEIAADLERLIGI
jgi:hypothetical protein